LQYQEKIINYKNPVISTIPGTCGIRKLLASSPARPLFLLFPLPPDLPGGEMPRIFEVFKEKTFFSVLPHAAELR
jgi:hypothetical protein